MEILFETRDGSPLPREIAQNAKVAGRRYQLEVPESEIYGALEKLRDCQARILSVTPLRPTLEDYFMRLMDKQKSPSYAVEVTTP
jgi:hypothetical protein